MHQDDSNNNFGGLIYNQIRDTANGDKVQTIIPNIGFGLSLRKKLCTQLKTVNKVFTIVQIIFNFLWDHWAHCGIFENGVLLMYTLEGLSSVALLLMKSLNKKKVKEKSRECHNHKLQPFPDPKRKRKPTNLNKHNLNKHTKSTKISSLFPKRGNRNTKRTEKHKNKMTHEKTYSKSPRRINTKQQRVRLIPGPPP